MIRFGNRWSSERRIDRLRSVPSGNQCRRRLRALVLLAVGGLEPVGTAEAVRVEQGDADIVAAAEPGVGQARDLDGLLIEARPGFPDRPAVDRGHRKVITGCLGCEQPAQHRQSIGQDAFLAG